MKATDGYNNISPQSFKYEKDSLFSKAVGHAGVPVVAVGGGGLATAYFGPKAGVAVAAAVELGLVIAIEAYVHDPATEEFCCGDGCH